ncbi:MAG: hypothetical protein JWM93_2113 [Frankiales bacterium]|nr:hypothetical protein [Frankiales bacterium]
MGLSDLTPEGLARFVQQSCAAQGVPVHVSDIAVLRRVATLLGGAPAEPRARARSAAAGPAGAPSQTPDGVHAVRVEALCASGAGSDDGVIEDGADNRVLALQGERLPLGA